MLAFPDKKPVDKKLVRTSATKPFFPPACQVNLSWWAFSLLKVSLRARGVGELYLAHYELDRGFSARAWGRVFALSNLPTVQAGCRFYATVSFMDERQAFVNRVARICCSCIGISTRLPV